MPPLARAPPDAGRGRWRPRAHRLHLASPRSRRASSILTIIATCRFSACPTPTTVFLTRLAAYSATGKPVRASDAMATPRACPSFSADCGSRLTNVSSIAASWGPSRSTSPTSERWIAASRSASEDAASVPIEPQLRKLSRDPAASITPHPVVRSPGSTPRMRIAAMVMACLIYEFPRQRIWTHSRLSPPSRAHVRARAFPPAFAPAILALAAEAAITCRRTAGAIREERREVGEEAVAAPPPPAATAPHFDFEREAFACGHRWVAGVDEVGRGPLAGPVGVAAVILDPDDLPIRGSTIRRSLPEAKRESLVRDHLR